MMAKWCAGAFFGLLLGWVLAHQEVAAECSRLRHFFVGENTFTCSIQGQRAYPQQNQARKSSDGRI